jgi:hypothetical protein
MKAIVFLGIIGTLGLIGVSFYRQREWKKLLLSIAAFSVISACIGFSPTLRTVVPLFMAHLVLILVAWSALIYAAIRGKFYWPALFAPLVTVALFFILEKTVGSGGVAG